MRVVIAGSRSITDYRIVERALDVPLRQYGWKITEVVSGTARGVDRMGEQWAVANHIPFRRFPADWEHYGKLAGVMRNRAMADYADALVAVWDGGSRGTKNMIEEMRARSKPVYVLRVFT